MKKVKVKNWMFDQDGESKFDSLSEKLGKKSGKVVSFIGASSIEIIISLTFGTLSALMKFAEGFNKGMDKQK